MEANVIYRIVNGDERAFDAFMDFYSGALYRYAYGVVGNREDAEEVVSDVFVEIWKNRKGLLEIESMQAYLYTITYRKAVSMLRHTSGRADSVSLDGLENFTASTLTAPDQSLISREELDALNRAIESLPPKCRHVFYLAKIERLPYNEISRMLDVSLATVNYHVGYAMNHLKKLLGPGGKNILSLLLLYLATNNF
ncbi:MAG: RNA polymerase sigma-70 factor [Muribaculaceae bacterium]|nr:RNA polymerase sigma-70 factor [Muribaculaceae bacterium]